MTLSEAEIERRLPLWVALSALFLDTAVDATARAWIAGVVVESGYSQEGATRILEHEVAPAFYRNLMSPTGTWTGWPEEEVRTMVLAHLAAPPWRRWPAVWMARAMRSLYRAEWEAILTRLPPATAPR